MVGTVVNLVTGPYASYIGHLFDRPSVRLQVGEGRSFLRASPSTYDIIQVFSNYTSSSVAQGSGAIEPVYLQTVEAYREYFSHLTPTGYLHISRYGYPRMIATAAAAWEAMGRDDFRTHVAVFEKQDATQDHNPTVLIKMTPWTRAEIADLTTFFAWNVEREPPYALVENPFDAAHSFLPGEFYSGRLPAALVRAAPYDVSVVTDDRPYFNFMRRSFHRLEADRATGLDVATAGVLNAQLSAGWLPMDWLHLLVSGAAGIVYGVLFVLVPLRFSTVGREPWDGKAPVLLYFSFLGFGFIAIELLFIQIFMKLIGYPLYAVATVITVMLVAAALGSMSSRVIAGPDGSRWFVPFFAVLAIGVGIWTVYPVLSTEFIGSATPIRILTTAAIIFPLAFFMGMPFPLGIAEIAAKPRGAIAWAWSMNGLFTAIGGVATAVLSLWLGFRGTVLLALGSYGFASIGFAMLRSTNHRRIAHAHAERATFPPQPAAPLPSR